MQPTAQPTRHPSSQPSSQPTMQPSDQPTSQPSQNPTYQSTLRIEFAVSFPLAGALLNVSSIQQQSDRKQLLLRSALASCLGYDRVSFNAFRLSILEVQEFLPANNNVQRLDASLATANKGVLISAQLSVVIQRVGFQSPSSAFARIKEKISNAVIGNCNSPLSISLVSFAAGSKLDEDFASACISPSTSLRVSSTYTTIIEHSSRPSSMPSSMPSCRLGSTHTGKSSGCQPCPPGSYSTKLGEQQCHACPPGTYSSTAGASSCTSCSPGLFAPMAGMSRCESCAIDHYMADVGAAECLECDNPSATAFAGSSFCSAFCVCMSFYVIVALFLTMALVHVVCVFKCARKLAITAVVFFPQLDASSDLAYLLTQKFFNIMPLFICSAFSLSHPFFRIYLSTLYSPRAHTKVDFLDAKSVRHHFLQKSGKWSVFRPSRALERSSGV